MRKNFFGYYRLTDEEFSQLWERCLFILDANVLLNLYRYPTEARDDLVGALEQVSDRLWIPHQVALEYQENRLRAIAEQIEKFNDVRKVLDDTRKSLRGGLAGLQLKKRHSSIDPDQLLKSVENALNEFEQELDTLEQKQPDVFDDDNLRNRIDALLEGKIGEPFKLQSDLDTIYAEGKVRYEQKCPPGYEDIGKVKPGERNAYSYGGLILKREYGDLILWFQIIEEAKAKGLQYIILVTDDEKEDWWWTVESRGKKTIGPRPELIEEIRRKANVSLFYMYNSERFLEFAKQYLGAQINQQSIDQVREIKQTRTEVRERWETSIAYQHQAELAVANWLSDLYPDDEVILNAPDFPDIILVNHHERQSIGYEVKYIRGEPTFVRHILRERVYRGYYTVSKGEFSTLKFVLVVDSEEKANQAASILQRPKYEIPEGVSFVVGIIVPADTEEVSPKFFPLFEI